MRFFKFYEKWTHAVFLMFWLEVRVFWGKEGQNKGSFSSLIKSPYIEVF